jgi:peptidyl-prolyl cis-trans isomerase B (cyclophilin B)
MGKFLALLTILSLLVISCGEKAEEERVAEMKSPEEAPAAEKTEPVPSQAIKTDYDYNPTVVIETDFGKIEVEVFFDKSPEHSKNFMKLVKSGFYDGLIFHRVVPGFVIQGGDPYGTGTGGPGYYLDAERSGLPHQTGSIAMAQSALGISGSQFYICLAPQPHLDKQFNVFAKVTSGMEIVEKIASVPRDAGDKPSEDVVMKKLYEKKPTT